MRKSSIIILICLFAVSCANDSTKGTVYKKEDFGKTWPFTVDEVKIYCAGYQEVYVKSNEDVYALNGQAQDVVSSGQSKEATKTYEEIWLDNPESPGYKIPVPLDFIQNALNECESK